MSSIAQLCLTLCDSMDCTPPGFPRQEYWSGFPLPSPGDLPGPRIEPMFPAFVGRFCTTELSEKPFTFPPCYQGFLESPSYKLLAVQSSSQDLLLEEAKLRLPSLCWRGVHMGYSNRDQEKSSTMDWMTSAGQSVSDNTSYKHNTNAPLVLLERVKG